MERNEWSTKASRLLKAELDLAGVSYSELVTRLAGLGIEESYKGIANKINRGAFSFSFFMQCMKAIDKKTIRLDSE
ncbi:MAG: hypothetical protein HYS18_11615 [Burkholderiales bacterium]|nr:hypothetical protein [Burkholderiales bacterium]